MKATLEGGKLKNIGQCFVIIGTHVVRLKALPDLSDGKGAAYNDEPIIGRSQPAKTFSHGENRVISMVLHFFVTSDEDLDPENGILKDLYAIESAVYPRQSDGSTPYRPPIICIIRCGDVLGSAPLCVVLRRYSVQFPTDVVWDENTLMPYKFDVQTEWEVVYATPDLPNQENIIRFGV